MIRSFTELEVWKKARQLRKDISKLAKSFPAEEKYRLADQIIRSSRSIGNNIAEGMADFTTSIPKSFI
jgi:four helix bundle protein